MSSVTSTLIAQQHRPARRRPTASSALLLLFGLGLLCGATALAAVPDPAEPAPAPFVASPDVESHVARAAMLYKAGSYMEAANELNAAYSLQPQPVFLFNIAQAYRKAQLHSAAKTIYQRFITVAPTHILAPEARGYIQDMEVLERAEIQNAAMRRQLALEQQREQHKPLYRRGWFWGTLGGVFGASALAVGLGVGLGLARRDPPTSGGFVELTF